jgi:hypothetical protein
MKTLILAALAAVLFTGHVQADTANRAKGSLMPLVQTPPSVAQAQLLKARRERARLQVQLKDARARAVQAQAQLRQAQRGRALALAQSETARALLQAQRKNSRTPSAAEQALEAQPLRNPHKTLVFAALTGPFLIAPTHATPVASLELNSARDSPNREEIRDVGSWSYVPRLTRKPRPPAIQLFYGPMQLRSRLDVRVLMLNVRQYTTIVTLKAMTSGHGPTF